MSAVVLRRAGMGEVGIVGITTNEEKLAKIVRSVGYKGIKEK